MPGINDDTIARVRKRVSGMPEGDILDWMDSMIPAMHQELDSYRRTKEPAHLGELRLAELQIRAFVDELATRASDL